MITTVTVTGADISVKASDLAQVAAEYPFVEFGILWDNSGQPKPRFPSMDWVLELLADVQPKHNLALSCHLRGQAARDFLEGVFLGRPEPLGTHWKRCQINTYAVPHAFDARRLRETVKQITVNSQQVIFQYDRVNTEALLTCTSRHVHDDYDDGDFSIASLFDLSHGAGLLPERWEPPLLKTKIPCGFAGGLSPENAVGQIERILEVAGDAPFWIDVETHLRSDEERVFDLEKVRRFLAAVKPYVIDRPKAA
jgi:hypothetical protein